jgi:hypothetical protein
VPEAQQNDETAETTDGEQPKDDSQQEQPAGEQPEDKPEAGDDEDVEDLDVERAKEKITKANAEAKNLRNRLRDAEEKLKNAKSPEEVDEIIKQLQADRETAEADLLRENVALKFKLPEKAIKRLAGSTREELEADAKELADLFGTHEDDDEDLHLEGGLEPRDREAADSDDPRVLAKKYSRRSKRR